MQRFLRREERERDLWRINFFPPKACPESGINDGFDCFGIRQRRQMLLTTADRLRPMTGKVGVQPRGDGSCSRVGLALHREFWNGAAARARRIPSFSMRACSVLRFNPSDVAAPFGPLITQFEASRASRMCRRSASSMVPILREEAGVGRACRSLRGTFKIGPVDRITRSEERGVGKECKSRGAQYPK